MDAEVEITPLAADRPFGCVTPRRAGIGLLDWVAGRRALLDDWLAVRGALLFRGFADQSALALGDFMAAVGGELMAYRYRSTPRTLVGDRVYTATEYPRDHAIPLHNENAYQRIWPNRLAFQCVEPATRGGRTPIAFMPAVTWRIGAALFEEFTSRQVLYVRNYGLGVDLPWQTVFQAEDRGEVEAFCRMQGIVTEWGEDGCLRTRQVCQGSGRHPVTGEPLWFNQAHLFHISSLPEPVREDLLALFDASDLPRNAFFGDGAALDMDALDRVRAAFAAESFAFDWQAGDVLLLDNMLVAHGRESFEGSRRVLVAMGAPNGEPPLKT